MRSIFFPFRANPAARDMLVVVLPVPPFCEAIETIIRSVNILKATLWVFQHILKLRLVWQKEKAGVKRQFTSNLFNTKTPMFSRGYKDMSSTKNTAKLSSWRVCGAFEKVFQVIY